MPEDYEYDRVSIEAVQTGFRRLMVYARHKEACERGIRIVEEIERDLAAEPPESVDMGCALSYGPVP